MGHVWNKVNAALFGRWLKIFLIRIKNRIKERKLMKAFAWFYSSELKFTIETTRLCRTTSRWFYEIYSFETSLFPK